MSSVQQLLCLLVMSLECQSIFSLGNSEIDERRLIGNILEKSKTRNKRQMGGFPGGFQFAQGAGQQQFACCQRKNARINNQDEAMIQAKYECRQKVEIAIYQASKQQNGADNIQSNPNTIPFEFVRRWRAAVVCTMDCVSEKYNLVIICISLSHPMKTRRRTLNLFSIFHVTGQRSRKLKRQRGERFCEAKLRTGRLGNSEL